MWVWLVFSLSLISFDSKWNRHFKDQIGDNVLSLLGFNNTYVSFCHALFQLFFLAIFLPFTGGDLALCMSENPGTSVETGVFQSDEGNSKEQPVSEWIIETKCATYIYKGELEPELLEELLRVARQSCSACSPKTTGLLSWLLWLLSSVFGKD